MAAVALVDIGALDRAAGELLGAIDGPKFFGLRDKPAKASSP